VRNPLQTRSFGGGRFAKPGCINNVVLIEAPKSDNGIRTLPMDDELVASLMELCRGQADKRLRAGDRYASDLRNLEWYVPGDVYLAVDRTGIRCTRSGTPTSSCGWHVRLGSHISGCMTHVTPPRASWGRLEYRSRSSAKSAGRCDPSFTFRTYVHANDDDVMVGSVDRHAPQAHSPRSRVESCAEPLQPQTRIVGVPGARPLGETTGTPKPIEDRASRPSDPVHRQGLEPRTR
jgi:hypothetical protein